MDSRCKDTKKLQIFLPFPNYFLTLQQFFDFILDTDIGSSTDDLFAMQMLYRYADEGKCKFLGVVVD